MAVAAVSFNPYQILGVDQGAGMDEIRQAYRSLARKYHPDINRSESAEELFKNLGQAYAVLSNAKKRALFDEFGEVSLSLHFDPQRARQQNVRAPATTARPSPASARAPSPASRTSPTPRPRVSADVFMPLEIDLGLAISGGPVTINPPQGNTTLEVNLPPNVETGFQIRFKGRGRPGSQGRSKGDLILEVHVLPHPFFRREGPDLFLELPLTVPEAFYGTAVEIPTPQGWIKLTIPKGSRGGERLLLRGKGVSRPEGGVGDLIIHLCVRLPEQLKAASRLLDRLTSLYRQPLRQGLRL